MGSRYQGEVLTQDRAAGLVVHLSGRNRRRSSQRHGLVVVLAGFWLLTVGCERTSDEFLLGGIQVNEPEMDHWHRSLLRNDFNTVSLTVYARQQVWNTADLVFDQEMRSSDLVREMRAARTAGLRCVLVLRLALDHAFAENEFLWHGMVLPRSEAEIDAWFYRYGDFVKRWAEVAQREGVEILGIGSELTALTNTRPVEQMPGLERYYLDQEAQELEVTRLRESREVAEPEAWRRRDDALSAEPLLSPKRPFSSDLESRTAAQVSWALEVTGEEDLEFINRRRRQLERNWRRLIGEVREIYSGKLTYAANFDQVGEVGFWDALDLISVNAYFPLRDELRPGTAVEELNAGFVQRWREILGDLDQLRRDAGTPQHRILFTELGYTARRGSTLQPWAGSGFAAVPVASAVSQQPPLQQSADASSQVVEYRLVQWDEQPLELQERAAAIASLAIAAREMEPPVLAGVLYWKLSTLPQHREIEPFVVILDTREETDPALASLRRLAADHVKPRGVEAPL